MNKHFSKIVFVLGAAAFASFQAQAAAAADPWPVESAAQVYFGDTDGSGPRTPDVPAAVAFSESVEPDGPVATASASIVDPQGLDLRDPMLAGQDQQAATALARKDDGGSAAGMH